LRGGARNNAPRCRALQLRIDVAQLRLQRFTGNLLGLDADGVAAPAALRFRGRPVEDHIALDRRDVGEARAGSSSTVAADAVLVRAGERLTPVAPAVERDDALRLTQDIGNRFAGFLGTIAIPADARSRSSRSIELGAAGPRTGSRSPHRG
jgi:hypothetical protein